MSRRKKWTFNVKIGMRNQQKKLLKSKPNRGDDDDNDYDDSDDFSNGDSNGDGQNNGDDERGLNRV